jgi:hypothetical protein
VKVLNIGAINRVNNGCTNTRKTDKNIHAYNHAKSPNLLKKNRMRERMRPPNIIRRK